MPKLTKELLDTYKTPASPETGYIKVGMNTCGISAGAQKIYDAFVHKVKEKNIPIEIKKCGCLGMCHAEPLIEVKIGGKPSVLYGRLDREKALSLLENKSLPEFLVEESPGQKKIVLRNCGVIDPERIEDYLEKQGYQAIKKSIFELGPEKTIEEIKKSGLRGRGGAGFQRGGSGKTQEKANPRMIIIMAGSSSAMAMKAIPALIWIEASLKAILIP